MVSLDRSSAEIQLTQNLPFECAATLDELALRGGRLEVKLANGRNVLLVSGRGTGEVHALDAYCYHHGGPLADGDIEDLPGASLGHEGPVRW